MDDFARAFFGINDGDWGEVTYTFDDVVPTLNSVSPHDWAGFLRERVYQTSDRAPLAGFTRSGYRLVYTDTPTDGAKSIFKARESADFTYSLGITVGKEAKIGSVLWGSPAFEAGLTTGQNIVSVNGHSYSEDVLKDAVTAAKVTTNPINLIVKRGEEVRPVAISWNGGLRYPRFEKVGKGVGPLDKLLAPR
jgi:predicted metalloprotease with PDZ domain